MAYIGHSPSTGEDNNFKILDDISSYTLTFDGSDSSVVSTSAETIYSYNHRFVQGQRVKYTNGGGGDINGLTNNSYYFIIKQDHNNIKLATSASNASDGTAVNITAVGSGSSHTLNVAFDGVNTKFKATHTTGQKARITRGAQLVLSVNGVIQQPHDSATPSTGFGFDLDGTIVFSQAPQSTDAFWGHILTNNNVTFDISDNKVDHFSGDGSTSSFTLSKSPPNNENILVTIDGVVQYPNDGAGNIRAYSVDANVINFTTAPGSGTQIEVRHIGFAGSTTGSGGVTGFYGRTGNVTLVNTDNITVNDAAITGDATITGDLTVNGTTTTLDTNLIDVDKIEVAAAGNIVAVAITQSGTGDILNLYDGSSEVFSVADGGAVTATGDITISKQNAVIELSDPDSSDANYQIRNDNGTFDIKDSTNNNVKIRAASSSVTVYPNLNANNGLDVMGTITGDGNLDIADSIRHSGDVNTKMSFPANDTISFDIAGSERLRIESSGNVGIGTTDPHKKLHVVKYGGHGAVRIEASGNGNRSGIEFYRETSAGLSKGGAAIWVESDTSSSAGELRFGTASNAAVQSQGTDMILNNNGYLGIGTDSLDGNLHVSNGSAGSVTAATDANELVLESPANVGMSLLTANDSLARIKFGDPDANGVGGIIYNHATDKLQINTGSGTRFMIGSDMISARTDYGIKRDTGGYTFRETNEGNERAGMHSDASNHLIFKAGGANEYLRIKHNGNVGIGTDDPSSILHVSGSSTPEILLKPTDATPALFVGDSNRTGAGQHLAEYRGNWNGTTVGRMVIVAGDDTTNKDNGEITFNTAAAGSTIERLRITSGGDVQVNGGALHLDASGELAVFETDTNLTFTNSAKLAFDFSGSVARIRSSHNGSGTTRNLGFYHANSQKLLITTDKVMFSADAKVDTTNTRDLGADGAKWKTLYLGTQLNIDAASSTEMIMLDAAGTNFARIGHNTSSGTAIFDLRSEGHTRFLTNGNNEKLRILSGGQVNIGDNFGQTTYKTQIEATDQNVLRLVTDSDNADGVELVLRKDSASPADEDNIGNIYFQGNDDGGNATFYASMEAYSSDVSNNSEDGYIRFRTRNDGSMGERLRIDSNGRIGINETTPDRELHISNNSNGGSIRLTNTDTTISNNTGVGLIEFEQRDSNTPGVSATIRAEMQDTTNGNCMLAFQTGTPSTIATRLIMHGAGTITVPLGPTNFPSGTSASALVNVSGRQPNTSDFQTGVTSNKSTGWYTIAVTSGGRATARFGLRDQASSRHQAFTFYAAHHYGGGTGQNCINTIFSSGKHSGNPLGAIRIKAYGTYDGAMLQVYLRDGTNNCQAYLFGDNCQSHGWKMVDWIADGTDPGGLSDWSAINSNGGAAAYSDLDHISHGGASFDGHIIPGRDDATDLGTPSYRFDDVFATNTTVQGSSDERLKQDIASLTTAEMNAAKRMSALFKTFRWKSRVSEKGDKARTHTGVIAQQVKAALEAEGLDPTKYGFYGFDEWYEDSEGTKLSIDEPTREGDPVGINTNASLGGNIVVPDGFEKKSLYSIRIGELLAFIAAYNEQRFTSIESRLTALESS